MACLDTSVLVDISGRAGRDYAARALACLANLRGLNESLTTTRFTLAELYVGAEQSDDMSAELEVVRKLVARLRILEFDDRSARQFGRIQAMLLARGRPIGELDALIAAVAIANQQKLVTRNARHFIEIPVLRVETY